MYFLSFFRKENKKCGIMLLMFQCLVFLCCHLDSQQPCNTSIGITIMEKNKLNCQLFYKMRLGR
jgi:hypothetical protein